MTPLFLLITRTLGLFTAMAASRALGDDVGPEMEKFAAGLPIIYRSEGFGKQSTNPEWNPRKSLLPPAGGPELLGMFASDEKVTLKLNDLPKHNALLVRLELVIIWHWDGVWKRYGPDEWRATVVDGPCLLQTTFSNFRGAKQNFPEEIGPCAHPPFTRAATLGNLGWTLDLRDGQALWKNLDATYELWFAVHHHSKEVQYEFSGVFHDNPDPLELRGEGWAIANCEVRTIGEGVFPPGEATQKAASSLVNAEHPPHPAALPLLVLASNHGLEAVEALLKQNNLKRLIPTRDDPNGKSPEDRLAEIQRDLASDRFKTREAASARLAELLPTHHQLIADALESEKDPEARARLHAALQKPEPPKVDDDGAPIPTVEMILTGRLKQMLRLQPTDAKVERWRRHLQDLEHHP